LRLFVAADRLFAGAVKNRVKILLFVECLLQIVSNCLYSPIYNHPAEHLKTLAVHHFRRFSTEVLATDDWMAAKRINYSLFKILTLLFALTAYNNLPF
jgi:hypothetical protein